MNKKEKSNHKEQGNQNFAPKKMNTYGDSKRKSNKNLPWWVELLFVQIGLPDRFLIKILKTKKNTKELIKKDKKSLITVFFVLITLAYFYPVIKHAKNKLECEATAKDYIVRNKNMMRIRNKEIKMLSTNFCYGGKEIMK